MSYTPTNWQTGDVVTSEKLNKLEDGVVAANGGLDLFVVKIKPEKNNGARVLDKTAEEIINALTAGKFVVKYEWPLTDTGDVCSFLSGCSVYPDDNSANFHFGNESFSYVTLDLTDYPVEDLG